MLHVSLKLKSEDVLTPDLFCIICFFLSGSFWNCLFVSSALKFCNSVTWYGLFAIHWAVCAMNYFILEIHIFLFGEIFYGYFVDNYFLSVFPVLSLSLSLSLIQLSDLPDWPSKFLIFWISLLLSWEDSSVFSCYPCIDFLNSCLQSCFNSQELFFILLL